MTARTAAGRDHAAAALAVLSTGSFLASLDVWITNVGLPSIGAGVGAPSLSDLSWVLNGYAIVYAALLVPAGRVADRIGRREAFLGGLAIFAAASLGAAASGGVWPLVGFRVVQAVGAAVLTPASLGLVLATAPPERVSAYVKVWATAASLAAAVGPAAGGLLIKITWRWLFLINLPIAVAAGLLTLLVIPATDRGPREPLPDLLGGAVLAVAVGALAFGLVKTADYGLLDGRVLGAFGLALFGSGLFVRRCATHPAPIIELTLFRRRSFSSANLVMFMVAGSFSIILLSVILWLEGHWGYSTVRTGIATAPVPLMFMTSAAVSESLQTRVKASPAVIVSAALSLICGGALLMAWSVGERPHYVADLLPGLLIMGAGFGSAIPLATSSATADLPKSQAAAGSAIVTMARQIGTVVGVSIIVTVLGSASQHAPLATFRVGWLAAVAVAAAGAVCGVGLAANAQSR